MTSNKMQQRHEKKKEKAPLELNVEFLSAVMKGDYNKAHILCRRILDIEPENNLCKEFHEVLNEVINKKDPNIDEKEEESCSSDDGDETSSDTSTSSDSNADSIHENGVSSASTSETSDSSDSEEIPIEELKNMSLYVGGLPANIRKQRKS